jgi:hypothetical protein
LEVRKRSNVRVETLASLRGERSLQASCLTLLLTRLVELYDFIHNRLCRRILLAAVAFEANERAGVGGFAVLGFANVKLGNPPNRRQFAALGWALRRNLFKRSITLWARSEGKSSRNGLP